MGGGTSKDSPPDVPPRRFEAVREKAKQPWVAPTSQEERDAASIWTAPYVPGDRQLNPPEGPSDSSDSLDSLGPPGAILRRLREDEAADNPEDPEDPEDPEKRKAKEALRRRERDTLIAASPFTLRW
jgi:hypothetical protein